MATEIRTWELLNGQLRCVDTTLADHGRTENLDLEAWIASDSSILRDGMKIIGRQVPTRSGPLDLLGVDATGDIYVIELKRDRLPREAIAQAIDYASDVRSWSLDRLSEICAKYTNQSLEDVFKDSFPDTDLESITVNESQRIILAGFSLDPALERMIEWLSDQYGVSINAVILKYVRTSSNCELLTRTAIISEETEGARARNRRFTIEMSDEPGKYSAEELKTRLAQYLLENFVSVRRIKEFLLPACLKREVVSRKDLRQELIDRAEVADIARAGAALAGISNQMGRKRNDFLRQVIAYDYPNNPWEKDNYKIRPDYRQLVSEVLQSLPAS